LSYAETGGNLTFGASDRSGPWRTIGQLRFRGGSICWVATSTTDGRRFCYERLGKLTAAILNEDFPIAHGDTADIVQDSWLRLRKALEQVRPTSVKDFFGLASRQIRFTLLELIRSNRNRRNLQQQGLRETNTPRMGAERAVTTHDPESLAQWTDFHERIDALRREEREVVDLIYYQGMSHAEAAEVLAVPLTTVDWRWRQAKAKLAVMASETLARVPDDLSR
jgi:RNA polymerase sigma-70 factor (ECF subfamily)